MTEQSSEYQRLPCGCQMGTDDDKFIFIPHSLDCKYYLYTLAESKRQGKPIITIDAR